jgi:hypothetical protein
MDGQPRECCGSELAGWDHDGSPRHHPPTGRDPAPASKRGGCSPSRGPSFGGTSGLLPLGLIVEDAQTSTAVAPPGRARGATLAASPPSSQPPASRKAGSGDGNDSSGDRNPEECRVGCSLPGCRSRQSAPELSTASQAWCCWSLIRCVNAQSCEAMVEQSSPTRGTGEDAAPEVDASPSADPRRRRGWRRPRWLVAKPRRPPWWEVPPQGYLEVESRNSPTSPRALRTLARTAARAGLSWSPGSTLPVQRLVEGHERARLVFQARRELPRVTAVASQVMLLDSRLAEAEETLQQAANHRSAAAVVARRRLDQPATAARRAKASQPTVGWDQPPDKDRLENPARPLRVNPWSEAAILVVMAGGQAVLAYVAASDAGLEVGALGLLALVAAAGSIVAAQLAARGLHRLGGSPEGSDDPRRRRRLDIAVAGGALACGVTLATGIGLLGSGTGPPALGLALLGLATAWSYAATPRGAAATNASRWRSVTSWLERHKQDRRSRRQLQDARAREAAAHATVRQLREELASCSRPSSRRCCSGATRWPSVTPHDVASNSSWPPTACAGPEASGGRSPTGGGGLRRRQSASTRGSSRSVSSNRTGATRWRGSPWRPSGCWSDVGCLTSPTGCDGHRCRALSPSTITAVRQCVTRTRSAAMATTDPSNCPARTRAGRAATAEPGGAVPLLDLTL